MWQSPMKMALQAIGKLTKPELKSYTHESHIDMLAKIKQMWHKLEANKNSECVHYQDRIKFLKRQLAR
jgi:polyhydroxyalkanoate synthesis regulator phasin